MSPLRRTGFPSSVRPLAIWAWSPDVPPEKAAQGISALADLGFGGAVVALRSTGAARAFLSPGWMEALAAAHEEARRIGLELWVEAPLADVGPIGLFPGFERSAFLALDSPGSSSPRSSEMAGPCLAAYRRDKSGQLRRIRGESGSAAPHDEADFALRILPGPGPDFLAPGVGARYIQRVLEPHAEALPKTADGAFRGFFLGWPQWSRRGEPWSPALAGRLKAQGFADPLERLPELFGEAFNGPDRPFSHCYRRAVADKVRRSFAEPLVQWAHERGLEIAGPVEEEESHPFPAWVFGAAGAARCFGAPTGGDPRRTAMAARLKSWGGAFVALSTPVGSAEPASAEAFRFEAASALAVGQARAVLDWAPAGEGLGHTGAKAVSLLHALPGLKGLSELNLRLATLTAVGQSARRRAAILLVSPKTSLWRLSRRASGAVGGLPSGPGRAAGDAEALRLERLLSRVDSCLRALAFDYDLWDERRHCDLPLGIGGALRFGDTEYRVVVLPGLLNLETPTWHCLADLVAGGGKALALERFPAFLDGAPSERLTDWARRHVERFETLDQLAGRLAELVDRPARSISLARGSEPLAPEVTRLEGEDGKSWIVARNVEVASPVRGILEIAAQPDEYVDEVDLDTGNLKPAPESVRLESALSLDVELAPAETRVFRLQKAPLAEAHADYGDTPVLFAEICIDSAWRLKRLDENLFPLERLEYRAPGLPWLGPEAARDLPSSIRRQMTLLGHPQEGEVELRARWTLEQAIPVATGFLLDLALLALPQIRVRCVSLNGEAADPSQATPASLPGLMRIPLPLSAREGPNVLEIRAEWPKDGWDAWATPIPWILSGRFGVAPQRGFQTDEQGRVLPWGDWALRACAGQAERMTDFVDFEMSVDRGIQDFQSSARPSPTAWADWRGWPLLRGRKWLHQLGFPFFGGMVELGAEFFLPEPGPVVAPWRRAVFQLGRTRAAWASLEINGREAGGLGLSPFRCDVTALLRPGARNQATVRAWIPWLNALAPFFPSAGGSGLTPILAQGFGETPRILLYG